MRFGEFEADPASGELRRNGARVKLQDLPFRVLVTLAARPGETVTRDELRAALWGAATFVDAEAGLNTAIAKLRDALGDSAEAPRFIETLPRRGYRFIGTLARDEAGPPAGPAPARARRPASTRAIAVVLMASVGLAAFGAWRWRTATRHTVIAVVLFRNETGEAGYDRLAQELTDATVVGLAANPRYAVIGNAAILRTPRIFADVQKIGEALRARYLIVGQLQNAGGPLVLRAHFIRTADQTHLWATAIPADGADVDARVQKIIAQAVNRLLVR